MKFFCVLAVLFGALFASTLGASDRAPARPNIVLILADDMGFSDLGCYGSEIPTPHLDALATGGLRFTQFYNTARCSPTRAALLTGLHPHQAGMGRLAEEVADLTTQHPAGYLSYLAPNSVTIAEALRPSGYRTYMAGKWHLGQRDQSKWPLQRGFDRFYGLLTGVSSYFKPVDDRGLTLDNRQLPPPTDPDYYTTDAFTDFAIQTVREHTAPAPFFLYLAFTAPHWPLHARPPDIAKFTDRYRAGWDALRAERHARQKSLGLFAADAALSPRNEGARAWDTLTPAEQTDLAYRMAVYAAQVHRMDWNIGRLVATLRDQGQLENTVLIFLSDNGGCAEPYTDLGGQPPARINDPAFSGPVSYGTGWANASNTPFRNFKSQLYEGGIATPLIVHWPAGLKAKPGSIDPTPGYITDIMSTVIALGGASYPKTNHSQPTVPLEGRSLLPILAGSPTDPTQRVFAWEQYGYKAVRAGDLKAVFAPPGLHDRRGRGQWELYDLSRDRAERHDLAATRSDDLAKMVAHWDAWAARAQVFPVPPPPAAASGKKKTP